MEEALERSVYAREDAFVGDPSLSRLLRFAPTPAPGESSWFSEQEALFRKRFPAELLRVR